ncbi:hypothetical protein C8R43DRAFT_943433 [Mycena crocata]|nr:hypothetical protein C8R43DRAFT_943433 [Mycena crocata]
MTAGLRVGADHNAPLFPSAKNTLEEEIEVTVALVKPWKRYKKRQGACPEVSVDERKKKKRTVEPACTLPRDSGLRVNGNMGSAHARQPWGRDWGRVYICRDSNGNGWEGDEVEKKRTEAYTHYRESHAERAVKRYGDDVRAAVPVCVSLRHWNTLAVEWNRLDGEDLRVRKSVTDSPRQGGPRSCETCRGRRFVGVLRHFLRMVRFGAAVGGNRVRKNATTEILTALE